MSQQFVRTNEFDDGVVSLEMLEIAAIQARADPTHWKWVIVALHSSLQSAMTICLSFGTDLQVARPKDARAWLAAHRTGGDYPEKRMDSFMNLYKKVANPAAIADGLIVTERTAQSVSNLNTLRNEFIHFMPKGWSIEIQLLREICTDGLDLVAQLPRWFILPGWDVDGRKKKYLGALGRAKTATLSL